MLIWSIFLTGVIALLFFMMYPRTDYIKTVETPIAQTAIIQFTEQHKSALELALKAVQKAAEREDEKYQGSGTRANTLTIPYPDFADLEKNNYMPKGLDQLDWRDANGDLIQSRIVCINYDDNASATLSTEGTCSIGGYTNMNQTTISKGTRDYLITYSPKPAELDEFFPGWGVSWAEETKDMDTCGIVKNGKIQSPKCPNGLCDLSASANTTRLQNLIDASGLSPKDDGFLEDDGFVCISPIDHYAYDGVSITGKNKEMLAYYDGINNTWTGHSNTTKTWYDLSGNENHGYFYRLTQSGNTGSAQPLTSVSGWQANGYKFSGALDFLSLPEEFTPTKDDLKEQGVEILADLKELKNGEFLYLFVGLGNYYLAISRTNTGNRYRFNTLITDSTGTGNAFPWSRYLSSAEVNAARLSVSVIWKTNYKLMTQDLYLYGEKANNAVHADKFQYKKNDRSGIGAKMRNAIGISYAGASPSYSGRIYVARLYNIRLTPAQIALNYQLDRKRFNIPKVVDDNDKDYTYLQGDGNAYLDSTYKPNSNTQVKANFTLTSSDIQFLYGARIQTNSNTYAFVSLGTAFRLDFGICRSDINCQPQFSGVSLNKKYKLYQDKNKLYLDDILKATSASTTTNPSKNLYIFDVNPLLTSIYKSSQMKLYSFEILENDEKQHDFIPAEDPFGRPSLYDKITGKFFYNDNKGTGKFTLGTD